MAQRPTIKQPTPLNPNRLKAARMPADTGQAATNVLDNLQAEIAGTEAAPLWNFVLNNARAIALGVVALVAIIVGVAVWQWHTESGAREARAELGRIISQQDPATRLASLEKFASSAPKSVALAANMELAAAAVQAEAWDKAVEAYTWVTERDKGGPLALAARMNRADVYLRRGRAAEALKELDSILPNFSDSKEMTAIILQQIAEAAEAAGDKARAISAYEKMIAGLAPESVEEADFYKARIDALQ